MNEDHEVETLLSAQDWDAITIQLVAFAFRRLRRHSLETAREVAQEAITRLWDPKYKKWNPQEQPSLLEHLGSVVNGIVRNQYTSAITRTELLRDAPALVRLSDRRAQAYTMGSDARLDAESFLATLSARLSGDHLAEEVLATIAEGIDLPREQAAHLKQPVIDIYNAKRRILDHVAAVSRSLNQEHSDET